MCLEYEIQKYLAERVTTRKWYAGPFITYSYIIMKYIVRLQ